MADSDDYEESKPKKLVIFGRDVSQIPCFRESFLYGMSSGLVIGLGAFMTTSKPPLSTHVGFSSFIMITFSYWCYCRYEWSKQRILVDQIQEAMRRNAAHQGTDKQRQILDEVRREAKEA